MEEILFIFFLVNHMDIAALMLTVNDNYVIFSCVDSRWQVFNEAWRVASKVSHQAPTALCGLDPLSVCKGARDIFWKVKFSESEE